MIFKVERPYRVNFNNNYYVGYVPQVQPNPYPVDTIEADCYVVTNGILELYKGKDTVAIYSVGNWVSVIKEKDNK